MMNNDEFLRQLYYFKAFGYKFINDKISLSNSENMSLSQLNLQIKECNLCELCKSRNNPVFGKGSQNAKVIFVLDTPTQIDDESGVLFSGAVGEKFYEYIFEMLNFKQDEIFITSLLKCKPTIRADLGTCFELCAGFFETEILNISPKIIVTLGENAFAMLTKRKILGSFDTIRANVIKFHNMLLMPTFSPFWIAKNPSRADDFLQDLSKIRSYL